MERVEARYFGESDEFFSGECISVAIYKDDVLYGDSWFAFNQYGGSVEVEPHEVYIYED